MRTSLETSAVAADVGRSARRPGGAARCIPGRTWIALLRAKTLRLRLIKVAARLVETTGRVHLAFAACCPEADLFRGLPAALMPCGP
ncbi:transposase [Bradyrhizobium sp. WD16]|uniref:transposase n=1 Tax=Bradyrhizobium sp. WD16 TaxID=1521768 RepID=UPI0035321C9C